MSCRVHVLHENPDWVEPLEEALRLRDLPFQMWDLSEDLLALDAPPPRGVFYCRMSASAHTRGHLGADEQARTFLSWLEHHGRRVVNGRRALELEMSKARQCEALAQAGVQIPETRVALDRATLIEAAQALGFPLVVKPNQGGKGLGVRRFDAIEDLQRTAHNEGLEPSPDGVWIVQRYVHAREPHIIRNEFVGGELLYAVKVDTSQGFELCPADACSVEDLFCPAGEDARARFEILEDFEHPDHAAYRRVLDSHDVEIAGIELIIDGDGESYTYDINVNTNYNSAAERRAGIAGTGQAGMMAVAGYLERLLAEEVCS